MHESIYNSGRSMCEICDDTGWKRVDTSGVRRVDRCGGGRESSYARALEESGIPPRYRRCDLERFSSYNDSLVVAVNKARHLVESFPVLDKGLLFIGQPGIGKTHLAVGVLKS